MYSRMPNSELQVTGHAEDSEEQKFSFIVVGVDGANAPFILDGSLAVS